LLLLELNKEMDHSTFSVNSTPQSKPDSSILTPVTISPINNAYKWMNNSRNKEENYKMQPKPMDFFGPWSFASDGSITRIVTYPPSRTSHFS